MADEPTPEPELTGTEENEGDPEIEGLLKEFEDAVRPEKPKGNGAMLPEQQTQPSGNLPEGAKPNADYQQLAQQHAQLQQDVQDAQDIRDVDGAIDEIGKSVEDLKIPRQWVDKLVTSEIQNNEVFQRAFLERFDNPGGWVNAVQRLGDSLRKEASQIPDLEATATHDAIAAAVMAASGKGGEPFEKESQADFERKVKRMSTADLVQAFPELGKNF